MKEIVMRTTDSLRNRAPRSTNAGGAPRSIDLAAYAATAGAVVFIMAMTLGMMPRSESGPVASVGNDSLRASLSPSLYRQTPPIGDH